MQGFMKCKYCKKKTTLGTYYLGKNGYELCCNDCFDESFIQIKDNKTLKKINGLKESKQMPKHKCKYCGTTEHLKKSRDKNNKIIYLCERCRKDTWTDMNGSEKLDNS